MKRWLTRKFEILEIQILQAELNVNENEQSISSENHPSICFNIVCSKVLGYSKQRAIKQAKSDKNPNNHFAGTCSQIKSKCPKWMMT